MSLREEQCKKVCRILDNVLANRPTERDSLIVATRKAFDAMQTTETKRGKWIKKHRHYGGFRSYTGFDAMGEQHTVTVDERTEYDDLYCSECGARSADNFLNFCPNCGSRNEVTT